MSKIYDHLSTVQSASGGSGEDGASKSREHDAKLSARTTTTAPNDASTSVAGPSTTARLTSVVKRVWRQWHGGQRKYGGLLRDAVHRQTFYAHTTKLLALFVLALVHFVYMHPFLDTFSLLEDYAGKLETKLAADQTASITTTTNNNNNYHHHQHHQQQQQQQQQITINNNNYNNNNNNNNNYNYRMLRIDVDALIDYRKNVWMTVAAMCVTLSTSCFFLFIAPLAGFIRPFHVMMIGVIDLIAFATLPALLAARAALVVRVNAHLADALRGAHRVVSAEPLMNALQCTVQPREKLAFCSQLILDAIFPVALLKYLLILCALTLAYILLAYLIDYCIRHWFPPGVCYCSGGEAGGGGRRYCNISNNNNNSGCYCALLNNNNNNGRKAVDSCCWWNDDSSRGYGKTNKSYLPPLIIPQKSADGKVMPNDYRLFGAVRSPLAVVGKMPTVLPNPLNDCQLSPVARDAPTTIGVTSPPSPPPTTPASSRVLDAEPSTPITAVKVPSDPK